ncbi:hypothetical protein WAI453_004510 [Rhynchosporium graminicola]
MSTHPGIIRLSSLPYPAFGDSFSNRVYRENKHGKYKRTAKISAGLAAASVQYDSGRRINHFARSCTVVVQDFFESEDAQRRDEISKFGYSVRDSRYHQTTWEVYVDWLSTSRSFIP